MPTRVGYKFCLEHNQNKLQKLLFSNTKIAHKVLWSTIRYIIFNRQMCLYMISHVNMKDFCNLPLFEPVFVTSPDDEMCVSIFYHQSYRYCQLSLLVTPLHDKCRLACPLQWQQLSAYNKISIKLMIYSCRLIHRVLNERFYEQLFDRNLFNIFRRCIFNEHNTLFMHHFYPVWSECFTHVNVERSAVITRSFSIALTNDTP